MNITNMEKVIAAIEDAPDKKFNMCEYIATSTTATNPDEIRKAELKALVEFEDRSCGTTACVAGWTLVTLLAPYARAEAAGNPAYGFNNILESAQELLELSEREALWLFMGKFASDKHGNQRDLREVTKAEAIAEMRRMVRVERAKNNALYGDFTLGLINN